MSNLAAVGLAVAIVLTIALLGPFESRVYRSDPDTPKKLLAYGLTAGLLWVLTGAAVRIEGWERLMANPAAGETWLCAPTMSGVVLGLAVVVYGIVGLMPLIQGMRGPRWRQAYAAAFRRAFAHIPGLMPNTRVERAAWVALSLTAGICEETLFRGFLIRFLRDSAPGLPLAAALLASSLMFGLAHLYQGLKGVVGATVGGIAFGLLFLLSGSLIACMALHALLDLQMAYVLSAGAVPRQSRAALTPADP